MEKGQRREKMGEEKMGEEDEGKKRGWMEM